MKKLIRFVFLTLIVVLIGILVSRWSENPPTIPMAATPLPTSVQSYLTQGEEYFSQGDLQDALVAFETALRNNEDPAQPHARRGDIYARWRRFREAEAAYSNSLSFLRDPSVLAKRCNTYRLLAEFEKARADCDEAINLDPENVDTYISLAMLYLEQSDLQNAGNTVDLAIATVPDSPEAYFVKSQVVLMQGNFQGAIEAISKSIDLDPAEPTYYWERGFLYYSTGDLESSAADLQKVVDLGDPETDGELMYKAGSLLSSFGGEP